MNIVGIIRRKNKVISGEIKTCKKHSNHLKDEWKNQVLNRNKATIMVTIKAENSNLVRFLRANIVSKPNSFINKIKG